ncbi:hypothetical protein J4456_00270 [Candidatus Pacearchaeota archaeon]|nr:hypothetical protein [Candidatus Pacearchaeota archaeon]
MNKPRCQSCGMPLGFPLPDDFYGIFTSEKTSEEVNYQGYIALPAKFDFRECIIVPRKNHIHRVLGKRNVLDIIGSHLDLQKRLVDEVIKDNS